jgi:hypothetical protein
VPLDGRQGNANIENGDLSRKEISSSMAADTSPKKEQSNTGLHPPIAKPQKRNARFDI